MHREVQGEALTGETDGPAIEPRNQEFGMPMLLSEAEGNTEHGVIGVWGAMEPKTNVSSESHRKGAFRSPAHPPGITL